MFPLFVCHHYLRTAHSNPADYVGLQGRLLRLIVCTYIHIYEFRIYNFPGNVSFEPTVQFRDIELPLNINYSSEEGGQILFVVFLTGVRPFAGIKGSFATRLWTQEQHLSRLRVNRTDCWRFNYPRFRPACVPSSPSRFAFALLASGRIWNRLIWQRSREHVLARELAGKLDTR